MEEGQKIAHLLRRAGFGAGPLELAEYQQRGFNATLDEVLNFEQVDEDFSVDPWALRPKAKDGGAKLPNLPAPAVAAWWAARMLLTRRPLQEKLTLFWHDHFGCSAEKVKGGAVNLQHNELLRRRGMGSFQELLLAVAQDPTMMQFLDTGDNVAGHPNENFARELMELFTLGIGNYTEKDVQEAARAFTGWTVQRPDPEEYLFLDHPLPGFRFRAGKHDDGSKTVLGASGNFGGEDVIALLCRQPQCHRYIAGKLWNWFAYPDPDAALVERIAGVFRDSGLSIRATLQAIFTAPEFYSDKALYALYKSPADFVIGSLRSAGLPRMLRAAGAADDRGGIEVDQLGDAKMDQAYVVGEGVPRRVLGLMRLVQQAMKNEGMALLFPPSVAGWDGGSAWVNSATMVERIKLADIFSPQGLQLGGGRKAAKAEKSAGDEESGGRAALAGRAQSQQPRRIPAQAVLGGRSYATTQELVEQVVLTFGASLSMEKRAVISAAVSDKLGSRVADSEGQQAALFETARLVFACPEYQMM